MRLFSAAIPGTTFAAPGFFSRFRVSDESVGAAREALQKAGAEWKGPLLRPSTRTQPSFFFSFNAPKGFLPHDLFRPASHGGEQKSLAFVMDTEGVTFFSFFSRGGPERLPRHVGGARVVAQYVSGGGPSSAGASPAPQPCTT